MEEIKSKSIQFVVTSPPYWNLKKYDGNRSGIKLSYPQYLNEIQDVLKEVKRVVDRGRFVAINVGTAVTADGMKPINADIITIMQDLNFIFKKEIIWIKPKGTQGLWQRGVTKFLRDEPYPCFFNLNIMHEYILIFQNEGELQINLDPEDKLSQEFIKQVSWSVWDMSVSFTKGHPSPFPDLLVERLIKLYTFENETILDPFGGSGTTMKVSRNLKRNSILYEINPRYIEIIKNKVDWDATVSGSTEKYEIKIRT